MLCWNHDSRRRRFRSHISTAALLWGVLAATAAAVEPVAAPEHKVVGAIATSRVIPGEPYELAGKRMIFANWYFIDPGDLDWHNDAGKSVYVDGNEGPFGAHFVGKRAPHGIRIRAEKPRVIGPFERPHRMIRREGDVYQGWTNNEYYESKDAMHWVKKARIKGDAALGDNLYQIFVDPTAPPSERYKAVWTGHITRAEFEAYRKARPDGWEPRALLHLAERDEVACLRGGVSADGITWKTLPDPIVVEYCDTWNTGYFDSVLHEYVLYTRQWSIGPRTTKLPADIRNSWTGVGRRAIGRTSSRDFRRFPPSEMILEPTPEMLPSEQLYTNCHTSVPGAPDQHLMFPSIWNASIDDSTRVAMASSHDGKVWHWVPGGDLLRTQAFGQWNGGCVWATPELIELPGGDWALPYLAHTFPHKYPRGQNVGGTGYAVWPRGRMVAVEAEDRGEFTTIAFIAPGQTVKLNAVTGRTGWVKVEVLGAKGHALTDCVPLVGDLAWTPVAWKGASSSGIAKGMPVRLRIELKQAKLYGIEMD